MRKCRTRNVNLTSYYDEFVNQLVTSGRFSSASEVMRAGLRLLELQAREEDEKLALLRSMAAESFNELDRGQGIVIDSREKLAEFIGQIGCRAAEVVNILRPAVDSWPITSFRLLRIAIFIQFLSGPTSGSARRAGCVRSCFSSRILTSPRIRNASAARPVRRSLPLHGPIISGTAETAWSPPATAFVARATSCYIEFSRVIRWRSDVCSTSVWILRDIFPRTTGPGRGSKFRNRP